jgi:hypothetical protein
MLFRYLIGYASPVGFIALYVDFVVEEAKTGVNGVTGTQDRSQQDFLEGCPLIVAVNAFILIRNT